MTKPASARFILGDAALTLASLPPCSVDLTLSDIPYGISLDDWDVLHNNTNSALGGQSPGQTKLGAGFKRRGKPINGWSKADLDRPKEYQEFCSVWARPLLAAMKPGGSVMLFCGRRTMHRAAVALEDVGFLVRDILAWEKPSAHHRAQKLSTVLERRGQTKEAEQWEGWRLGNLAPMYEPILWLFKPYKIGQTITDNVLSYGLGAMNTKACSQAGRSPGNVLRFDFSAEESRVHEAQKPIALLAWLIELTSREGHLVLDPFTGSGSTAIAALRKNRNFLGIEADERHVDVARARVTEEFGKSQPCDLPT